VATADQIKILIKSHFEQDGEKFKTTALQIAAYEAKIGHTKLAREIKAIIDKTSNSKAQVIQMKNQNQLCWISVPNDKLTDLIAPDELINKIKRVLDEYKHRSKLNKFGLVNRRKLLLEGASGTGKTLTASIIASELNMPLFVVQMDKLVTKYMGETSIKLRQIFDSMESSIGVYLFDEFDAIGADRSIDNEVGEMRRVLNSFLQFIEQDSSQSIIIAATNNPKILDQALFRRFDDVLHYAIPTKNEVQRMFRIKLGSFDPKFKVSEQNIDIASSLSHAEISRVCEDAIKEAILNESKLTQEYIQKLIKERLMVYCKEAN
jgi:SpoVK/Ycf46/Vps4 family AAA+-type ATPase